MSDEHPLISILRALERIEKNHLRIERLLNSHFQHVTGGSIRRIGTPFMSTTTTPSLPPLGPGVTAKFQVTPAPAGVVTEAANANNPSVVGRNLKGVPDMAGRLFRDNIVEGALKNGTGWEDYVFTMPGKIGLFYKSVYYKLVTGSDGKQYVVCVGRYKDKQE